MKKYINKIVLIVGLMIVSMILMPAKVHAGLQANKGGTSLVNTNSDEYFTLIRGMEIGTLGLPTQNAQDGIDCHMIKNTEWGSIALLAVSSEYGSRPQNENQSTTGNASGIYQLRGGKCEYTSNFITGTTATWAQKIKNGGKYSNEYGSNASRINGDALNMGGLAADYGTWDTERPVAARDVNDLFKYGRLSNLGGGGNTDWSYGDKYTTRAAVVCGSGL